MSTDCSSFSLRETALSQYTGKCGLCLKDIGMEDVDAAYFFFTNECQSVHEKCFEYIGRSLHTVVFDDLKGVLGESLFNSSKIRNPTINTTSYVQLNCIGDADSILEFTKRLSQTDLRKFADLYKTICICLNADVFEPYARSASGKAAADIHRICLDNLNVLEKSRQEMNNMRHSN
jgi:hypothetical protein